MTVSTSALAITEEHRDLAESAFGLLRRLGSRAAARSALGDGADHPDDIWSAAAELGWLGLAVREQHGGSGYGVAELAVILEALGHELAPGPFLPTVAASLIVDRLGTDSARAQLLPRLIDGSGAAAIGLAGEATLDGTVLDGNWPAALGAPDADVLLLAAGDDVVVVDAADATVTAHRAPEASDQYRSAR